ncbi:hypothetical protein PISL3812_08400 [Talaromyces islandicus]|uniref:IgE-binding protein n=1 Tax=Talaromyces islandicus TaxID=28573 RepID=A0A0U1M7L1_TALIS|nr:hypothetical protein PISL3812_08400 [Talaromyces islandicus]
MQLIASVVAAASLLGASVQAESQPDVLTLGLTALRSASPIHFGSINAANSKFWIWGPGPKTYCPPNITGCQKTNSTLIDLYLDNGAAGLYANIPGGQDIFVAPDGSLSFTEPHMEGVFPPGSIAYSGFTYTAPAEPGTVAILGFKGNGSTGFVACPRKGAYPWQIYVQLPGKNYTSGCLGFDVSAANVTNAPLPWEFI